MSATDRDSSVKLRAILEFPASSLKTFETASIMGSWISDQGVHVKLRQGQRAVATRVSSSERGKICAALGISEKTFNNHATHWVKRRLAHRCQRGVVTLFMTPLRGSAAVCPACGKSLNVPRSRTDSPGIRDESPLNQGGTEPPIPGTSSENEPSSLKVVNKVEEKVEPEEELSVEEAQQLINEHLSKGSSTIAPRSNEGEEAV